MACEAKRACGYRKVGGLYLCADGIGCPCCKMPIILDICPTCGNGVKQTRGWTWIDPRPWLRGGCTASGSEFCPGANPEYLGEKVGLLWIGAQFYPTPESFARESFEMGVSRRIAAVPRGFKVGEHWVFLAHPRMQRIVTGTGDEGESKFGEKWLGGVFRIFKPTRIEKIVTQSQSEDAEEMEKLAKAGITPVIVPDNDKDHQGSVYDKDDEDEPTLALNGGANHQGAPL